MKKIPKADEFLAKRVDVFSMEHAQQKGTEDYKIKQAIIDFAKLHVKAALVSAADKSEKNSPRVSANGIGGSKEYPVVDGAIILNSYPLTNVK